MEIQSIRVPLDFPCWHVAIRGVRGSTLFGDDADRRAYCRFMDLAFPGSAVRVLTGVLMGNHLHDLVAGERAAVGRFFHQVNSRYAMYFNRRQGLKGHAFEADFRPLRIENARHLLNASLYIHANPVKDFRIADPAAYEYSTFQHLLNGPGPVWFDCSPLLRVIGPDPKEAKARYLQWMRLKVRSLLDVVEAEVPQPQSGPRIQEGIAPHWTNRDLVRILPTLVPEALTHFLSRRTGIPREGFLLYVARQLGMGSVTRICSLLGVSRKSGATWLGRIEADAEVVSLLGSVAVLDGRISRAA